MKLGGYGDGNKGGVEGEARTWSNISYEKLINKKSKKYIVYYFCHSFLH